MLTPKYILSVQWYLFLSKRARIEISVFIMIEKWNTNNINTAPLPLSQAYFWNHNGTSIYKFSCLQLDIQYLKHKRCVSISFICLSAVLFCGWRKNFQLSNKYQWMNMETFPISPYSTEGSACAFILKQPSVIVEIQRGQHWASIRNQTAILPQPVGWIVYCSRTAIYQSQIFIPTTEIL